MENLIDIIRVALLGQLALLSLLFWQIRDVKHGTKIGPFFCLTVIAYLLVDWEPIYSNRALFFILIGPAILLPVAFWLFSKVLFDDDYQWSSKYLKIIGAVYVVRMLIVAQYFEDIIPSFPISDDLLAIAGHFITICFIGLGIAEAYKTREDDLILSRLKFRNIFLVISASVILFITLTDISYGYNNLPFEIDLIQKMVILALAFYFTAYQVKINPGFLKDKKSNSLPENSTLPKTAEPNEELLKSLLDAMEKDLVWKNEGLTIRSLAEQLEVKEYRLRQTINQHLNFRNFSSFLNSYRIREAKSILSNPKQKEMTILEIAYKIGYASIAPFNKAFKESTGVTPTEWRKENKT